MTDEDKFQERGYIRNIAFFGDANIAEDDPTYKSAYELGKQLASKGFTIVNGGGPGVMNASTQGAEDGGGKTISVTFDPKHAPFYEGRYVKNITDKEIKTTNYIERMFGLLEHSDAFVVFKGGSGTISEWGTVWVLAKLYFGHHKPFILFGRHWYPIIDAIRSNMNIDDMEMTVFEIVEKIEDVYPTIHKFEKKMKEHVHTKDCLVCKERDFSK